MTPAEQAIADTMRAELEAPCRAMVNDYQTSEKHHPNHILVQRKDFDAMRAAIARATGAA